MHTLRRIIGFLVLAAYLPACTTYRASRLSPEQAVEGQRSVQVKVVEGEKSRLQTLRDPWVRGDSLGGLVAKREAWAVPLSSVIELRTKQVDPATTAAAVVVGVVTVGAIGFFVVARAICGGDMECCMEC